MALNSSKMEFESQASYTIFLLVTKADFLVNSLVQQCALHNL